MCVNPLKKKVAQADIGSELHDNSIENRLAKIKAKSGNVKARRRLKSSRLVVLPPKVEQLLEATPAQRETSEISLF